MDEHQVIYDLLVTDKTSSSYDTFKEFLARNDIDLSVDVDDKTLDAVVNRANVLLNLGKDVDNKIETTISNDVVSHVLLRGLASLNEKIESWFVNNEAWHLKDRFLELDSTQQARLLKKMFGNHNVKLLTEYIDEHGFNERWSREKLNIAYRSDGQKYYVINWEIVFNLVSRHDCKLLNGLAFVRSGDRELGMIFMHAVRTLLRLKIKQTILPEETKDTLLEELEQEILDKIEELSGTVVGYDDIEEHVGKFPLCIKLLDQYLIRGKDLEHQELLQLGFFLKAIGFTLEDYRKYFFFRHPANKGKTYEEFVHSHWGGYQLKHHFGQVGSGKDYKSFTCDTSVKEGFCPYVELDGRKRRMLLESLYADLFEKQRLDDLIDKINKKMRVKTPYNCQVSCSTEFYFHYTVKEDKGRVINVKSPLNYYRLANRVLEGAGVRDETITLIKRKSNEKDARDAN